MLNQATLTDTMIQDGYAFLADNDVPTALMMARQCVKADPHHAGAWELMGAAQHRWREYDAALQAYGTAIEWDPRRSELYYGRGRVSLDRDHLARAAEDFKRALTIDPGVVKYLAALAECADRMDDLGLAVAQLEQCVALEPDQVEHRHRLIPLYLKLATRTWRSAQGAKVPTSFDEVQEAKRYLKKAEQLQATDPVLLQDVAALRDAIRAAEKRKFYVKKRPGIVAIVAGLFLLPTGLLGAALLLGGMLYFFALRPPQYDLNRRALYPNNPTLFDSWMSRLYSSAPAMPVSAGLPGLIVRFVQGAIPILAVPVMALWALFENYDVLDYARFEFARLRVFIDERLLDDPVLALVKQPSTRAAA